MSTDARTAEEKLTPEERRTMLRAFADRMLLKTTQMDDPEDMAGVEKAIRVASAIERIYSRCDRAEKHAPDPRKLEAERATNQSAAIKARVHLAGHLEWADMRRKDLGTWWDAADTSDKPAEPAKPTPKPAEKRITSDSDLRTSILAMLDTSLARLIATPSKDGSAPDILAATECVDNAQTALENGDIDEDDFDTIEDAVNDWLKSRPPPG